MACSFNCLLTKSQGTFSLGKRGVGASDQILHTESAKMAAESETTLLGLSLDLAAIVAIIMMF